MMKKLLTSLILAATMLISSNVLANSTIEQNHKNVDVMFIQMADSGSVTPIANKPNYYVLTLNGVKPYVGYFSDRPVRISGLFPTTQFADKWQDSKGKDSFNQMPPNAALSAIRDDWFSKKMVGLPLQLTEPHYDASKQTMTYTVQVLPGVKTKLPINNMQQVALFIDEYCASCAG